MPGDAMDRLEFSTQMAFRGLTREEKVLKCREMAAEAESLAACAAERRNANLEPAKKWCDLAEDMEREVPQNVR
jgi:hypothetical protein